MNDADCVRLLRRWLPRLGLRWEGFRRVRRQVCKRIARRLGALGIVDPADYEWRLANDADERRRLDGFCRITISRFFRDRAVFDHLRRVVLPALGRGKRQIDILSVGCASGEEPYSLVLAWRLGSGQRSRTAIALTAIDAEDAVLARAREARYAPGSLDEVPPALRQKAFERTDGDYVLKSAHRAGVRFLKRDARRGLPAGPFDLILCRNLCFTYFDEAGQRRAIVALVRRLRPGGGLVIGAHERLPADTAAARRLIPWGRCVYRLAPPSPSIARRQARP